MLSKWKCRLSGFFKNFPGSHPGRTHLFLEPVKLTYPLCLMSFFCNLSLNVQFRPNSLSEGGRGEWPNGRYVRRHKSTLCSSLWVRVWFVLESRNGSRLSVKWKDERENVCPSVWLAVCLPTCLPVYLSACLSSILSHECACTCVCVSLCM